jgi:predicted 2-oxoglutarate/Fe(II)-dependent dioxygenase YbiX
MTVTRELAEILNTVVRPGDFFVSMRTDFPMPRIEVEGVGPIALPLLPAQAKQLIKAATRAPYGRGSETLVDTKVRRTWQIEGVRVTIGGKHWPKTLAGIVAHAAEGLGVSGPITAELYKLLVYDKGSFFVSHRDTEKAPGMFATLVLALPSQSQGGELVVRHKERETRLDLRSDEPSEIAYAAFYADCVHEVLPVTAGCRATLVFNLVRKSRGAAPSPPEYEAEVAQAAALLGTWARSKTEVVDGGAGGEDEAQLTEDLPAKIVYPLEHAYTQAELSFQGLKGADAAVARLASKACAQADCDLHLALLYVWESGSAQYNGSYRRRYSRSWRDEPDEDEHTDSSEFEVIEVLDSGKSLSEWRSADGDTATLGKLPLLDDEVSPSDALDDMKPDEQQFREATGNEGASFERTYSRAALVIWPKDRLLAIINQGGPEVTLPYLADLLSKAQAVGAKNGAVFRTQAEELARLMIAAWSGLGWYDRDRTEPTETGRMFHLLAHLGEPRLIEAMLSKLSEQNGHARADNAGILEALEVLEPSRVAERLTGLVQAHGVDALGASAALLVGGLKRRFSKEPALLSPAASAIVAALPGDPDAAPKDQWGRPRLARLESTSVVDLVAAVDAIDEQLATRVAAHMLAWPRHFDLDNIIVPAIKRLLQAKAKRGPTFGTLLRASLAHLERRIAEPLEAHRDWTRPSEIRCSCGHCSELGHFLADPITEHWTLRAAQQTRTHVENEIRSARADLDCKTIRRGSPHSLVCSKNEASYRRRVAQRKQDLLDLSTLQGRRP